jgi:mono/diheme cytochrome c family protein
LAKELLDQQIISPMDTSLPKETSNKRAVVVILSVVLAAVLSFWGIHQIRRSDPYVQSVLSLEGDATRGQVIFQQNCSVCHGLNADGRVGPSLHHVASRKSRIGLIHQVVSGETPPMPQFQPTSEDMADLLKYLESL